jgi:uncharacterized membrane protein YdbT with pleckstrin-like domain
MPTRGHRAQPASLASVGFPDSILTSDEQVVLHLHPHWKRLVAPAFWLVVIIPAVVAVTLIWGLNGLLVGGIVALPLLTWLSIWPWLRWRSIHYVFTNERILVREGLLARHGRDMPLGRINDVSFSHTLPERMLGCGTLTVESAGERGQMVLVDLPRVERTHTVLYELVEADEMRHAEAEFDELDARADEEPHVLADGEPHVLADEEPHADDRHVDGDRAASTKDGQ